ncbi:hypothetical protein WICPIJ_004337 [Wickerhamomyces pijperi]|uniref:PH-response regulator protein palI/RIM9 n=1 Tax=Wickerhamomyces pijperi TaxID=599730 RepID=A0A9P8Q7X6_WICPI|nr:hypothetical protein WICPIJ_004337 [Wickerhamomyces pijperi]
MGFRIRPATTLLVLLIVVLGLQILAIISVPVTKSIALCTYDGYKFGVFGLCKGDECTSISIGYTGKELSDALSGFSLPSNARKSVSKLLIVHVVSAGFTLAMLFSSIMLHWSGPSKSLRFLLFNLLLSIPTFLLSLLSFLVDILLFVPHLDWGGWIVLAATVLISVCSVLLCIMRRTASSRHGHVKNYGKSNNFGEGGEYQLAPLTYDYGTVDGGSFVKPLESQDNDDGDDTFDAGYHSRYTDIANMPQTTIHDHVRDGSVVSSSHNGYLSRSSPYTATEDNDKANEDVNILNNESSAALDNPLLGQDHYQQANQQNYDEEEEEEEAEEYQTAVGLPDHQTSNPYSYSEYNTAYEPTSAPYPTTEPVPGLDNGLSDIYETKATAPYPISDPITIQTDIAGFQEDESSPINSPTASQPPSSPSKLLGPRPYRGSVTSLQDLMTDADVAGETEPELNTAESGLSKDEVSVTRKPTYRTQIENSLNALQPHENSTEENEDEDDDDEEEGDPFDFVKRSTHAPRVGRNIGVLDEDDFESSILTDYNHQETSSYFDQSVRQPDSLVESNNGSGFHDDQSSFTNPLAIRNKQLVEEDELSSEYSSRLPSVSSSYYPPSQVSHSANQQSYTRTHESVQYQSPNINTGTSRFIMTPTPPNSQAGQSASLQQHNQQQNHLTPDITSYHNPQTHRPTSQDLQELTEYKSTVEVDSNNLQLPSPDDVRSTPPPSFTGQSFASSHFTSVSQRGINPEYIKLHPEEFGLIRMQDEQGGQLKNNNQQQDEGRNMSLQAKGRIPPHIQSQAQQQTQAQPQPQAQVNELRPHGNMGRFDINKTGLMIPPKLNNKEIATTGTGPSVIDSNPDFSVVGRGEGRKKI